MLDLADILKLNSDELVTVTGMFLSTGDTETGCLEKLIAMFDLDLIVLTNGKEESRLFSDRLNDSIYKPKPVEVIDSIGAGDSFTAAVALGILNGLSLDRVHEKASAVASYVCSKKGATPAVPNSLRQLVRNAG